MKMFINENVRKIERAREKPNQQGKVTIKKLNQVKDMCGCALYIG